MRTRVGSGPAGRNRGVGEREEGGERGRWRPAGRAPATAAQGRGEEGEETLADTMFGE
jgi:hypothetical protein